jgi:hypothetical protein
MLALVLGAIRRRRGQALLLVVLGALAATGAAVAPGYIAATNERLAAAAAEQAAPDEALVRSVATMPVAGDSAGPVDTTTRQIQAAIGLPDFTRTRDVRVVGFIGADEVALANRDGVCDQVTTIGSCDIGPGHAIVDNATAVRLKLQPGDKVLFAATSSKTEVPLTIVATYTPRVPSAVYWTPISKAATPVIYTDLGTVLDPRMVGTSLSVTLDQVVTPVAFSRNDPQQLALTMELGAIELAKSKIQTQARLRYLADRVFDDQRFVLTGVLVGTAHLLVLTWLSLYLAIRQTARTRRPDVALVKMRGGQRRDLWLLLLGQSALPIAVGGLFGAALGGVAIRWIAGPVRAHAVAQQVVVTTLGLAAAAVLGAIVAAVVADMRMLRESVSQLARAVPGRGRTWTGWILDGVVVAVAAFAAYDVLGRADATGVGLLAPILAALAIGVLVARLVPMVASALAAPSLRAGALAVGLTTVNLARRRTMAGVVAATVLAVAVLAGAVAAWDVAGRAREDRASADVGAARVLFVAATSRGQLLSAVRAADPSGRYAMAAVETGGADAVLAVDTQRLAAVAAPAPYLGAGGAGSDAAWSDAIHRLRPNAATAPIRFTADTGTLDAAWATVVSPEGIPDGYDGGPVAVPHGFAFVDVSANEGTVARYTFGPLAPGRRTYVTKMPACTAGCRLVDVGIGSSPDDALPPVGTQLTVYGLTTPAGPVLGREQLTEPTQWRTSVLPGVQVPSVGRAGDGLSLTIGPTTYEGDPIVAAAPLYRLDAPAPVPVLLRGKLPAQLYVGDTRVDAFGYKLPITVVGTATALPRLGDGMLMDLEYMDRVLSDGRAAGTAEVWLSADAPGSIVDDLTAAGLRVVGSQSRADRVRLLAAQGPSIVLRFLLIAALVGTVLAVANYVVLAAVERDTRAEEFAALRRQGLTERVVWRVGVGSHAAVGLIPIVVAGLAAVGLRPLLGRIFPIFVDGYAVLPVPADHPADQWLPVGVCAVAVGLTALVYGRLLVRSARRHHATSSQRQEGGHA